MVRNSEKAIKQLGGEIAKLRKADPALKLHVVGHTDAVGGIDAILNAAVRSSGAG